MIDDGLSDTMKELLAGLSALHDFKPFRALYGNSKKDREKVQKMDKLYPNPIHPIVRTHLANGIKALYVNPH